MNNKLLGFPAAALLMILLQSCDKDMARISGQSVGLESKQVKLEEVLPKGFNIVDSTLTDSQGNYKFNVRLPDSQPTFYNIRIDKEIIPLLVSPGERIELFSLVSGGRSYQITGSKESALIKEVNDILSKGAMRLDSIADASSLRSSRSRDDRHEAMQKYASEYHKVKRAQIRFIVEHSRQLAAIYALQQRLPGDQTLFNGDGDIAYYRMVADSVAKTYPDSRYLSMLQNALAATLANEEHIATLRRKMQTQVSFPEISLPDIYGTTHKLSDHKGRIILLDFWSASETMAATQNAEYKEIYSALADSGFVIYQVNLDTSKPAWVNAVIDQKLPWISVSDLKGSESPAAGNYNISKVPANYLIDVRGDIVGKDIFGAELKDRITKLVGSAQ